MHLLRYLICSSYLTTLSIALSPNKNTIAPALLPRHRITYRRSSTVTRNDDSRIGLRCPGQKLASTLFSATGLRGGACDSNPTLLAKLALGTALQASLLLGAIAGGNELSSRLSLPSIFGLPLPILLSLLAVIFASSFFGTVVDGSVSAATNQVLSPNVVPGEPDWYANLNRPKWEPPGWVFPIMWLIVSKPTQLVAVSRLLKVEKTPWSVLAVYCTHLALGDVWNKVFFGLQCVGSGVVVITTFFSMLLTSAYLFWGVDEVAGQFMLPTCGWVFVATCLNWSIYLRNK